MKRIALNLDLMSGGIPVDDALAIEAELKAQGYGKSNTTYQSVVDIMDKLGVELTESIPCPEIEATFMYLKDNGWNLKEAGEVDATLTPMRDGLPNPKYKKLYIDKPWMDWWKDRMTKRRTLGIQVTISNINRKAIKYGLQLYKGKGYYYWDIPRAWDDKPFEETESWYHENEMEGPYSVKEGTSVYVYSLKHIGWDQWMRELDDMVAKMKNEYVEKQKWSNNQLADCFHECGLYIMHKAPEGSIMAHGTVTNPDGSVMEHAWIELGDWGKGMVLDVTNEFMQDKQAYYNTYSVDASQVKRYDADDTAKNMARSGHWGPWIARRKVMKRIIGQGEMLRERNPYRGKITVWRERSAHIDYDPSTGYFTVYEEGWWGPDDFTVCGLYGLGANLGPIDEFVDKVVTTLNKYDIPVTKEQLLAEEPTDTDKYWVYLGNQNYGALTGYQGMETFWDDKEEQDEEGNYISGYYEMDSSEVESVIDKTLDRLAAGKDQRQLAEDAGNKQDYIYEFIEAIESEVDMKFVPYD